jgi:hypothetical protein
MPGRVRRRRGAAASEAREWSLERDEALERAIRSGLGIRPPTWWRLESARPDLAEDAELDLYAHLDGCPARERAAERLRYLVASAELAGAELLAVETGEGPAHDWRRAVLAMTTTPQ